MMSETDKLLTVLKILLSNGDIDVVKYAMLYQFIHGKFKDNEMQYNQCIAEIGELHEKKKIQTNVVIEFVSLGTK